ncbi:response regulator transcription factor [Novosphingobium profundi]|uniref:response regulator transcription factor n=1 Tax=Novosphingobium profundi TaxID=1774954 RepID=UPI001BDB184D|nr:response regulator transcription factor [Novosphingobium profundi]MBT0668955.1 response regulator transcription factor [Novosphingobium profundi]
MSRSILIADDHPLFRQALALAVGQVAPDATIVEAGTLVAASTAVATTTDLCLILLDLKMPGAVGFSGIALLHAERPEVPILVVSSAEGDNAADEARIFGARGFLRKDADLSVIENAIAKALDGTSSMPRSSAQVQSDLDPIRESVAGLTPMQLKVLLAVLDGQLNKQIAHSLGVSEATVKAHMTAVMRKLDVTNRTQAALVARSLGLHLRH